MNLFLNSRVAREYGSSVAVTDGVNQSNINGNKLSNYPFPYCSIEEQGEIVSTLEKTLSYIVDETEAVHYFGIRQKSYALTPVDSEEHSPVNSLPRTRTMRTSRLYFLLAFMQPRALKS